MSLIVIIGCIWGICKLVSSASAAKRERERQAQLERIRREQERQREEQRWQRESIKEAQAAEKERVRKLVEMEREQMRLAKEQERQAAQLAKHEEQIAKLNQKMELLESEMRFNFHQRGSIGKLLNIAEEERDALIKDSKAWQKAQKKVISLENQYHMYDKRLNKAMSDYKLCKMQKTA